jgi:lupus La protein
VGQEVDARSLYASPFPYDASLDALTAFFAAHGTVRCVRMRRHLSSKDFKGSVFVEFATKEEADKVRRRCVGGWVVGGG